jgi:hypothetical protein
VWTLAAAAVILAAYAATPLGSSLIGRGGPPDMAAYSAETPLGAAAWLREHPPRGQVFNTYEYGDYLLWAGPAGLRVFVASHAHLVPADAWQDYLRVINLAEGWQRVLDRYGVEVVVVSSTSSLADALRARDEWPLAYEDPRSVIFMRRGAAPDSKSRWPRGGAAKRE